MQVPLVSFFFFLFFLLFSFTHPLCAIKFSFLFVSSDRGFARQTGYTLPGVRIKVATEGAEEKNPVLPLKVMTDGYTFQLRALI